MNFQAILGCVSVGQAQSASDLYFVLTAGFTVDLLIVDLLKHPPIYILVISLLTRLIFYEPALHFSQIKLSGKITYVCVYLKACIFEYKALI